MNTDIILENILNFSFLKLLIHDAQAKSWGFYFYFLQTNMLLLLCTHFKEFPI